MSYFRSFRFGTTGKKLVLKILLTLFMTVSLMSLSYAQAAPTIVEIWPTQNKPLNAGKSFDIKVNFSEVVEVTGTPTIAATIGSTTRHFSYKSRFGSTLTFSYVIVDGDNDEDGITLNAIELNGGSIHSTSGGQC